MGASGSSRFQSFSLTSRMVALADEFCHVLCILTILAAILVILCRNTATSGVRALFRFAHYTFSLA